jgi:hypothetical protein
MSWFVWTWRFESQPASSRAFPATPFAPRVLPVPQLPQSAPQCLDFLHVACFAGLGNFEQFHNLLHLVQDSPKFFDDPFHFLDRLADGRLLSRNPAPFFAVDGGLRLRSTRNSNSLPNGLLLFAARGSKSASSSPPSPTAASSRQLGCWLLNSQFWTVLGVRQWHV